MKWPSENTSYNTNMGTLPARISTGLDGLDDILDGGLIPGRSYLLRGKPGTGKTILGIHFLTSGVEAGENALYVNLEETEADVRQNATTLGFDLDGIDFLDLSPSSEVFVEQGTYDVFAPSEVEGDAISDSIADTVERLEPDRVFVDPITQLRYLTDDTYQFRKQINSFMRFLKERGATVLFTSQGSKERSDEDLQFLADGTIELGHGPSGRTISVPKFRGSGSKRGTHSMRINGDGIEVFPELNTTTQSHESRTETISSGVDEIDSLVGGGIERGTVTILSGPTGVGKTTTGTQFLTEAANRGERSVVFMFEESERTFVQRAEAVGMPVEEMMDEGMLGVEVVDATAYSPEEFAHLVDREVEVNDAQVVMIDGIDGYKLSLRGQRDDLVRKLHMLCRHLKSKGVTVILVDEVDTVTGEFRATNVGISYIADNIVFLRHIEVQGELHKTIGVLKKRLSDFERTLREFEITEDGIVVGDPLTELRGLLHGTPELLDESRSKDK